jgi:hypothetical protein
MGNLIADHARWQVSDWGLHAALAGPLGVRRRGYDDVPPRRALLAEVLDACETGNKGPVDLVYKQANIRLPEVEALESVIGPAERRIFCHRDPAAFMRSATKMFKDTDLDELRVNNYIGTIDEHARVGGDVFLYHPDVTGDDYAKFLRPLAISDVAKATVRYAGSSADELTTPAMWDAYERLAAVAINAA